VRGGGVLLYKEPRKIEVRLTLTTGDVKQLPPPHLRTETDPVSETLCFLVIEFRTMDKVQKPSINKLYLIFMR
jgi:hypothetical protein